LFGTNPRVGLSSTPLPAEIIERLVTENDLLEVLQTSTTTVSDVTAANPSDTAVQVSTAASTSETEVEVTTAASQDTGVEVTTAASQDTGVEVTTAASQDTEVEVWTAASTSETEVEVATAASTSETEVEVATAASTSETTDMIRVNQIRISEQRKRAREGQHRQAERMLKRSRVLHAPGEPDDNVTVPVPLVDRGRGDPRNIIGVILERDESDLYRIAVRAGVLQGKYSRNQFDLCAHKLLSKDAIRTDRDVSLRAAVQFESICGGQGFIKCNCSGSGGCTNKKCKCLKNNVKCNSRCHGSLNCCNKN
jgi:hypothetical protein